MKSYFLTAALLITAFTSFYFASCSSAEQTTAKLAYQRGDYKKAEEEFMKEVNQNPSNEEAWFYLSMSRIQLKNASGAKDAIEKYKGLKLNSFNTELINAWYTLNESAGVLFEDGNKFLAKKDEAAAIKKFQEANQTFEMAMILLPESTLVKENMSLITNKINALTIQPVLEKGVEYEKQGNFAAAIEEYKKGIPMFEKGTANYEIIIYDVSLAEMKWAEKIKKDNEALPEEKHDQSYKDHYNNALPYVMELSSSKDVCTQINAYELLVQIYANTGRTDEAKSAIETRNKLKTDNPDCLKENK